MMNDKDMCKDPGCNNLRCAGSSWCKDHGGMDDTPLEVAEEDVSPTAEPNWQPQRMSDEPTKAPTSAIQGDSSSVGTTIVDSAWLEQVLNQLRELTDEQLRLKTTNEELADKLIIQLDKVDQVVSLNEELTKVNNEQTNRITEMAMLYNKDMTELEHIKGKYERVALLYMDLVFDNKE